MAEKFIGSSGEKTFLRVLIDCMKIGFKFGHFQDINIEETSTGSIFSDTSGNKFKVIIQKII